MPLHDFVCPACGSEKENIYIELAKIDTHIEWCLCAPEQKMDIDYRRKTTRKTRSHKFPEFTLHHTQRLDGTREGREIHSLADVRAFERDHKAEQVCVEAFSYDSQQHIPEPTSVAEPERMTEQQKRDFVEKFRDLNIKDEKSARDY